MNPKQTLLKMTIEEEIFHENVLCKFCCDLETLKKHFYRSHKHCMVCETTFEDNDGIINHLLIKHDQRFQCKFCPYFNFGSNQLDLHMETCLNKYNVQEFDNMVEDQNVHFNSLKHTTNSQNTKKRGRPKGVKNSTKVDDDWTSENENVDLETNFKIILCYLF